MLSSAVGDRLNLQSQRIDSVSESAHQAHKITQDNAEILYNILVGMENLGNSVKQLPEEVKGWEEPEGQEELELVEQELRD